jgi:hypothetical protein
MTNRDRPSGISDDTDNIIYCAGLSENYFHEVVHIYLNRLFPNSPLKEGLAAFYGGSMGKDFTWHIKRVKDHLAAHPEINLDELDSFTYLDNYTNPISAIQALFCKIVYETEGIKGLRRLMSYAALDDIYEKEFSKGDKDKNTLIRELIAKQQ